MVVRQSKGDGGGNRGDGIDWDGAWTNFQKQKGANSRANRPAGSAGSARRAPAGTSRASKVSSPLDEIKRAEDGVLSPWSSALFAQLGIGAVVLLLIAIITVGGADIHDSRCTLPWCS